jgi:NAD(P)H-hydrate epimerase
MGRDIPQGLTLEFLSACQTWVEERNITLVLKGAPTFIFHPADLIHVCGKGDPGMATAGTGDVLTGIIAGLLSQNARPQDAARLGVFLHGLAGEHAAQEKTSYCMIASDLLEYLPAAFAFEDA